MDILLGLANMAILLTHGQYLQKLFFRNDIDAAKPLDIGASHIALFDFEHIFPVRLILINQQVNKIFFVNLEHLNLYLIFGLLSIVKHIINGSKDIAGDPWNDTHALGVSEVAEHGVGFAAACLPIGHDCRVVPL